MPGGIESRGLMNAREWIEAYAARLGTTPPSPEDFSLLLNLAGEAAHASERIAAPVACWVAARAGADLEEALDAAREISPEDG
jgi:hypothetical protein